MYMHYFEIFDDNFQDLSKNVDDHQQFCQKKRRI